MSQTHDEFRGNTTFNEWPAFRDPIQHPNRSIARGSSTIHRAWSRSLGSNDPVGPHGRPRDYRRAREFVFRRSCQRLSHSLSLSPSLSGKYSLFRSCRSPTALVLSLFLSVASARRLKMDFTYSLLRYVLRTFERVSMVYERERGKREKERSREGEWSDCV